MIESHNYFNTLYVKRQGFIRQYNHMDAPCSAKTPSQLISLDFQVLGLHAFDMKILLMVVVVQSLNLLAFMWFKREAWIRILALRQQLNIYKRKWGIIPPRHSLIFIQVLNQVQELLLAFRLQDVHNEMAILHAQATAKA
jgi:hypothetical protein